MDDDPSPDEPVRGNLRGAVRAAGEGEAGFAEGAAGPDRREEAAAGGREEEADRGGAAVRGQAEAGPGGTATEGAVREGGGWEEGAEGAYAELVAHGSKEIKWESTASLGE